MTSIRCIDLYQLKMHRKKMDRAVSSSSMQTVRVGLHSRRSPEGAPIMRATERFPMYSDMSMRTTARSLALKILDGEFGEGDLVLVDRDGAEMRFEKKAAVAA